MAARAKGNALGVRGAIHRLLVPVRRPHAEARVLEVARAYADMGVDEVVLADTPSGRAIRPTSPRWRPRRRRGCPSRSRCTCTTPTAMALAAVYATLEVGVTTFDAAIGGLGGCPYCPGAAGNLGDRGPRLMLQPRHRDRRRPVEAVVAARFAAERSAAPLASRQLIANAGAA